MKSYSRHRRIGGGKYEIKKYFNYGSNNDSINHNFVQTVSAGDSNIGNFGV